MESIAKSQNYQQTVFNIIRFVGIFDGDTSGRSGWEALLLDVNWNFWEAFSWSLIAVYARDPPNITMILINLLAEMRSPNKTVPKIVCNTPRTAEETMCVTGDVILIDRNPASEIKKPKSPVMSAPRRNVWRSGPPVDTRARTDAISDVKGIKGSKNMAEKRLL